MGKFLDRSIKLLGKDKVKSFENKVILLCGLGGVGGTALEVLARSGFKHFILVDFDTVDESNLNRQILYTLKDVGRDKTEVAKERILAINPDIEIEVISKKKFMSNIEALKIFYTEIVNNLMNEKKTMITSVITAGVQPSKNALSNLIKI